ncbi:GNAT family N-acetyltransferase (plasmid) [Cytobacillus spongiae]|uniref:GNAT family N-acetyltransferase n=1 Tax=Cytobacillus spongiae TaxID=2901381 RepID=UPI001F1B0140|nr:GNAT family N-acetyltransferase [Cytobacillus spongiae]UII58385.1 GNAT family N-acetyltransferase [Cytobacillus spongiae]
MISELEKSDYYKCRELIYEKGPLEAEAVIEGSHPGRIFVDDIISPTSGFIWLGSNNGFIFIGNEANEEFNFELYVFFNTVIKLDAYKLGLTAFEAIGNHSKWNDTFKKVFGENMKAYNQRVYEFKKTDYRKQNEPVIEQGYEVIKITKDIIENKGYVSFENINFLRSKILEFWNSFEEFLEDGIGYIAVYKNEIVSVCFSGVVAGIVHGVDIETLKHHQGKKLGQKVAHLFVNELIDNNITPYWDCMEINKPSVSFAENIGFKNEFNYIWYSISFKQI